ncbi:MAG: hypothetical protein ACHQT8_04270 [Chlamydiales bacterium]
MTIRIKSSQASLLSPRRPGITLPRLPTSPDRTVRTGEQPREQTQVVPFTPAQGSTEDRTQDLMRLHVLNAFNRSARALPRQLFTQTDQMSVAVRPWINPTSSNLPQFTSLSDAVMSDDLDGMYTMVFRVNGVPMTYSLPRSEENLLVLAGMINVLNGEEPLSFPEPEQRPSSVRIEEVMEEEPAPAAHPPQRRAGFCSRVTTIFLAPFRCVAAILLAPFRSIAWLFSALRRCLGRSSS